MVDFDWCLAQNVVTTFWLRIGRRHGYAAHHHTQILRQHLSTPTQQICDTSIGPTYHNHGDQDDKIEQQCQLECTESLALQRLKSTSEDFKGYITQLSF